jgi:calcineurin-like phosphoesterase family protein
MIYFTSDLHFYHANVIKYSNRPFKDVTEMNQALITNINAAVDVNDEMYILGDFGFCKVDQALAILNQINCKNLYYIMGNHDKIMRDQKVRSKFKSMDSYKEITIDGQLITMLHYPQLEWNRGHRGSWCLHGHTHNNLKLPDMLKNKRILDVGVDCHNYFPISFDYIKNLMKDKEDIIHHNRGEN